MPHPDKNMIALGIRQPWAELILRGTKTIEVRSTHTAQRGEIYVYASKKFGGSLPPITRLSTISSMRKLFHAA